jgi:MoxR-like ATPase
MVSLAKRSGTLKNRSQPSRMDDTPFAVESVAALEEGLRRQGYLAGADVTTSAYLALKMRKPLLLEGDPGVGKTALAIALSRAFDAELVRLQCYEGLDMSQAAYEWNFPRQLLEIRLAESRDAAVSTAGLFTEEYLLERPLLRALRLSRAQPVVLLIDELDRADEPFEAFLLEYLSEFQLSVPELGTLRGTGAPAVVITSNRTREIHDAVRRRCLYCMVRYPPLEREVQIVLARLPGVEFRLAAEVAAFVGELRHLDPSSRPGSRRRWIGALRCSRSITARSTPVRSVIRSARC